MTKADFFGKCGASASPLSVDIQDAPWTMDRAVYLNGSWNERAAVRFELYRAFPGRQFRNWQKADRAMRLAAEKFARWLEEWKKNNSKKVATGS